MATRSAIVTPVTAGMSSGAGVPARSRDYLLVVNASSTATIAIAFDTAAVVNGAGSITLTSGQKAEWSDVNNGFVPSNAINVIASASSTPVTIIE